MKTNQFIFAALTAAFLSVATFSAAQVTIGGTNPPAAGAILDLNSTTKGGLALSNVYLDKLTYIPTGTNLFPDIIAGTNDDVNPDFTGAIVWNTNDGLVPNGDGLYLWDGNKWNYIGGSDGFFSIPAPTCTNPLPNLIMASYNLGANIAELNRLYPDLSPAKQQIRFLADCPVTTASVVIVFGDYYQWGRKADGHEKLDAVTYTTAGALGATYLDVDGQVKDDTGGNYSKSNANQRYGHFIAHSGGNWYGGTNPAADILWGNGKGLAADGTIDKGGVLYGGQYYQNTDWAIPQNNPCPLGWRVPTQDEMEQLVNYGCNTPGDGTGNVSSIPSTGKATTTRGGNEFTFVPVAGGKARNDWNSSQGNLGGYAIYKQADWDKAIAKGGYFNPSGSGADYAKLLYDPAAPEPLLFLPTAGYRDGTNGGFGHPGTYGDYWSSTVNNATSAYRFATSTSKVWMDSGSASTCASGFNIRCVKN